jgi:hypothetical protein
MTENFTDKKRGYGGGVSNDANRLSAIARRLEDLGELSFKKFTETSPDGTTIIKRFGMYERQELYPIAEEESIAPIPIPSGTPFVAGMSMFGCLGTGADKIVTDVTVGGQDTWIVDTSSPAPLWHPNDLEPGGGHWIPGWVQFFWGGVWSWYVRINDEGAFAPATPPGNMEYVSGHTEHKVTWPVVDSYTSLGTPNIVWASTSGNTSFIVDSTGKMFCCGTNETGQLGIGQQTGSTTPTDYDKPIPNYYSTVFVEVGGNDWKQVNCWPMNTFALKKDGSFWATGGGNTLFTKTDNGPFTTFYKDPDIGLVLIKTVGSLHSQSYQIWLQGGTSPYQTLTRTEWIAKWGNFTPRQIAMALEGYSGYTISVVGGNYPPIGLSKGSLFTYQPDGDQGRLESVTNCFLASGGPRRSGGDPITGGATIAIGR